MSRETLSKEEIQKLFPKSWFRLESVNYVGITEGTFKGLFSIVIGGAGFKLFARGTFNSDEAQTMRQRLINTIP